MATSRLRLPKNRAKKQRLMVGWGQMRRQLARQGEELGDERERPYIVCVSMHVELICCF